MDIFQQSVLWGPHFWSHLEENEPKYNQGPLQRYYIGKTRFFFFFLKYPKMINQTIHF